MSSSHFAQVCLLLGIGGCLNSAASAQDYPSKPIRIITSGVGGTNDVAARFVAHGLSMSTGQQAVVENRGSGAMPGQVVSKAAPDGYTLLVAGGSFSIGPLLQPTPYDPVRDFVPISLVATQPNVLLVHPALPVRNVKELVAMAKARPGELNYASGGAGGAPHFAAELFKSMAGVNIVRVPYKSTASAVSDLLSGEVQMMMYTVSAVAPHMKSGRLKALAVTSAKPSALAPTLPTVGAAGVPGYEFASVTGAYAPLKTPASIINKLNQEIVRLLGSADVREKFADLGVEVVGSSPDALAATIKSEIARLGRLIKEAGIKAE